MAVWYESPAVVGLVIGAPMAIVAFLGWWRTRGMDATTKQAGIERKSGRIDTTEAAQLWKVLTDELKHRDLAIEKLEKVIARQESQIWDLRGGVKTVERELNNKADSKTVEELEHKIDKANGVPDA